MKNFLSLAGALLLLALFFCASSISAQNYYSSDIIHADWDLRFNWQKESIEGKVTYYCITTQKIAGLDAIWFDTKGEFSFKNVKINGKKAKYLVGENGLIVVYPKTFRKGRKFTVSFDYSVQPTGTDAKNPTGDDKGLYFVNATGSIPGWPTMCYSQCETENLSRFIPCHDQLAANDKFTAVISMTVPDTMVTLSNGNLLSQQKLSGKMRKDIWEMVQPNPSYLYFIAAGDFTITEDKWRNLPLYYYTEKQYAPFAAGIYRKTPEQLEFFSNLLGVPYPWESKYAQITVRRYGSGAMENTTCTLYGEHVVTGTEREIKNSDWNDLVTCHELFHHWFGDLVTASEWGNLSLNESFATLGEYLWSQHLDSNNTQVFRKNDRAQYFGQAYGLRKGYNNHPLIDTVLGNNDREKMFDRISYDKGGLILWMLKSQLGDSIFFKSLNHYLTAHQYSYAGPEDLKNSFEKISGQDLDNFFHQWFYTAGHPIVSFDYLYSDGKLLIQTTQLQKEKYGWGLFDLWVPVSVYLANGEKKTFWLDVNSRSVLQKYEFSVSEPVAVIPDEQRNLLVDWKFNYSLSDYERILFSTTSFMPKYEASDSLIKYKAMFPGFRWNQICLKMSKDKDWRFRFRAVENANLDMSNVGQDLVANGIYDPHYYVRVSTAQRTSGFLANNKLINLFAQDSSLEVQSAALLQIAKTDSLLALQLASARWELRTSDFLHERYITYAISSQFAKTGDLRWTSYFKSVCQSGNFYCRSDIKEPLKVWLWRMGADDRQDFLSYLLLFDGEFSDVIDHFVPKALGINSEK